MARKKQEEPKQQEEFPGYPHYPENQDIFYRQQIDIEKDPENKQENKPVEASGEGTRELDFTHEVNAGDLDVPGAELDDLQEAIGSEDEENNYYSLGGDNHEDAEEQNGE